MNVIRQIGVVCIVGLLFLKSMVAPLLLLDYELRKDYIVQNYCVNKDRPELHCDGKCYLAKRIDKARQEDEQQAAKQFASKFFSLEITFSDAPAALSVCVIVEAETNAIFAYRPAHPQAALQLIFRPPRA